MSENELIEQTPAHLLAAMQEDTGTGMEDMGNYIVPPRLKVIQDKKVLEGIQGCVTGQVVIMPQVSTLCMPDGSFFFTVLYMWDEFCIHNPYKIKTLQMIRERTLDPKSEIATKAQLLTREPCPEAPNDDDAKLKYVTHLNFLLAVHGIPELEGIEILYSAFLGEFKTGKNLVNLLRTRTTRGVPIYGHILEAAPGVHSPKSGGDDWYGLNITNPTAGSDISSFATLQNEVKDPELFGEFKAAHKRAKENKERFQAVYEDIAVEEETQTVGDTL